MKCSECDHKMFEEDAGGVNRYYCKNPKAISDAGSRLISKTERHSTELKTKTSPKWCPLNK